MKKPVRLIAALLAFCVLNAVFPPVGLAAGGTVHDVPEGESVKALFDSGAVADGDTIRLAGNGWFRTNDEAPWIIDREVTIEGGTLQIDVSGIVLAADVTFQNVALSFNKNARNAVIANGHTLTLENVKCANVSFNLFCGSLINSNNEPFTIPSPGSVGVINIRGKTNLQNKDTFGTGNIYAGNLSMGGMSAGTSVPDAPPNEFNGSAEINIEDSESSTALGTVYACGAQQKNPASDPPLATKRTYPDPDNYTVSGTVTIRGKVPNVEGAGSAAADVIYRGGGSQVTRTYTDISSLAVDAGDLALTPESRFRDDRAVSLASGAKLNLTQFEGIPNLDIGDFDGSGFLILGQYQTLSIGGQVTGATKVAIDSLNSTNTQSMKLPVAGHTYIQAPNSSAGNFVLLPYSGNPSMTLELDGSGNWTASNGTSGGDEDLITNFKFLDKAVSTAPGQEAWFEMEATCANGDFASLDSTQLSITVNWNTTLIPREDPNGEYNYIYQDTLGDFYAYVADNTLCITPAEKGNYTLSVTLPRDAVAGGKTLSDTATLSVSDGGVQPPDPDPGPDPDPSLTSVPVPKAVTGLVYTGAELTGVNEGTGYTLTGHREINAGSYTAIATLESGYQWEDGTTEPKRIPWSIAKAGGPAAPSGLVGVAPSSFNGSDGKITGTTAGMEYARTEDFANSQICGVGETTGLSAGIYYVRVRQTGAYEAGEAAIVEVPAYGVPEAVSIRVNSAGHKTDYLVDEALDVAGLTIEVVYVSGDRATVPVTANMVSGFDSSRAAEQQTLTIHYAGKSTSYTIRITAPETPVPPDPPVPGHDHLWNTAWDSDGTHHWHNCAAEGCPVLENSEKDGYAAHTAGAWVIDQAATATQSGSRYRACSVCGRELVRETIPATGGGSSGGSSSGGSSGGNSSGGTTTSTVKNPDGSTTSTSTNNITGTVTETTKRPDGSQTVIETKKDGTVTTTERQEDGSTVKIVDRADGSSETTVRQADGIAAEAGVDRNGRMEAQVDLPSKVVKNAQSTGSAVTLPIPEMPLSRSEDSTLLVRTGSNWPVKVEVPARVTSGTVAVIIGRDGSETVIRTSALTSGGVVVAVPDGAVVKLVDNSRDFYDTRDHWARDAIDFVSARELFSGKTGGAFAPDAPMTRAMVATVLARLDGADTESGLTWYEGGMSWAVTHGVSDGKNPDGYITREQLASMLYRYAGRPGVTDGELRFSDAGAISGYALEAMRWAVENGILSGYGDGTLAPGGKATRAQTAAILMRYVDFLNK